MNTLLLLDCSNIAHRNWYAIKNNEMALPVVYTFLRDLGTLSRTLSSDRFVFCFDDKEYARRRLFPDYKPRGIDDDGKKLIHKEIKMLKEDILPDLGYQNLFQIVGAEADDVIAKLCLFRKDKDYYVLVSTDSDLFQLLEEDEVSIWNMATKRMVTEDNLYQRTKLAPHNWIELKALSGCDADGIPGVPGVGPILAGKYINKELSATTKAYKNIQTNFRMIELNRKLVSLPFADLPEVELKIKKDNIDPGHWDVVMQKYNITQLVGKCP